MTINKNKKTRTSMDLSQLFTSQVVELQRSHIQLAAYNPREISPEGRKSLKRIIKKYGLVGGLVANKRTGNTLVSGHQRISVMDELQHYDPITHQNDYLLRLDLIDVDERTEKELNIALNNPNAQGTWNRDLLAEMLPDIDYKDVGLTEADLSLIGIDYILQTEEEEALASSLTELMSETEEQHQAQLAERKAQREELRAAERAAKVEHMKEVKQQVAQAAQRQAEDMDAYIALSFDNIDNKRAFLRRFGFPEESKYIKGEDFDTRCEAIYEQ